MLRDLLILENLSVALETLRTRKARSALTVLGIVIGVTSVISVAAIIDGLNRHIKGRITSIGSRLFSAARWRRRTPPRWSTAVHGFATSVPLRFIRRRSTKRATPPKPSSGRRKWRTRSLKFLELWMY